MRSRVVTACTVFLFICLFMPSASTKISFESRLETIFEVQPLSEAMSQVVPEPESDILKEANQAQAQQTKKFKDEGAIFWSDRTIVSDAAQAARNRFIADAVSDIDHGLYYIIHPMKENSTKVNNFVSDIDINSSYNPNPNPNTINSSYKLKVPHNPTLIMEPEPMQQAERTETGNMELYDKQLRGTFSSRRNNKGNSNPNPTSSSETQRQRLEQVKSDANKPQENTEIGSSRVFEKRFESQLVGSASMSDFN